MNTIVRFIILMTLFSITANAQSNPPAPSTSEKANRLQYHTENKQCLPDETSHIALSHFLSGIVNNTIMKHDRQSNYNRQEDNDNPLHRGMIWEGCIAETKATDWLLALFTLGLLIVAITQAIIMNAQAVSLRKTVKATEIAAKAAKDGAEFIPTLERAHFFIGITGTRLSNFKPISDETIIANVFILNFGRTHAIIHKTNAKLIINDSCDNHYMSHNVGEYRGIALEGGKSDTLTPSIHISPEEWGKIENKKIKLICYGNIVYTDITNLKRVVSFCGKWKGYGSFDVTYSEELYGEKEANQNS